MSDAVNTSHACRICDSQSLHFHFEVAAQRLWRCESCGFTQVEEEPTPEVLDNIYSSAYFTSSKYRGDSVALNRENDRRLDLMKRWVSPGLEILDAGCSTGDFVAHAKNTYRMHGLDYSSFAIDLAKERNPELSQSLKAGRIETTEWADKTFDAICLWDVIEHIWDPVSAVKDLITRIKPGGVILMSTPAIDSLMARASGRYWAFMTPPEHLSFFSLKAFHKLANSLQDCEIVYSSRRGKWANVAFIAYKLGRIAPAWFPKLLLWPCFQWPLKKLSIYVPTADVLYVVIRKQD